MAARLRALGLLTALGLLFFAPLVRHPAETLYSDCSDFLTLHLPSKRFLVRSFQETGELSLWCPYNLGGVPFIHDPQVSAFYPPHLPLYLLAEEMIGPAMSWLVVFHVIAAGWCAYAYARWQGLGDLGSFVAAAGYMLAGKWLLHLLAGGHANMAPLAWLPLVLLGLERAIRRRSLVDASWAGAVFSLFILGAYPYVTLYAGLFVAIWTFGTALEAGGRLRGLTPPAQILGARNPDPGARLGPAVARWLLLGAWAMLVAGGLGAVQLLPGLEAAGEASRSAGVAVTGQFVLDGLRSLVGLVGPALTDEPNSWENRAGLGLLWLALVLLAAKQGDGRTRYQVGVCVLLLAYVLGGAVLVQGLPGFRLFRLPSRMFLVAALPASLLAGRAIEALVGRGPDAARLREHFRPLLLKLTIVVLVLAGVFAVAVRSRHADIHLRFHPYWLSLLVTVPAALWLLRRGPSRAATSLWALVLLIDLGCLSWGLVQVRPVEELYTPSACVRYVAQHGGRVLDVNPVSDETSANSTPLWPGLPAVAGVEPVRGFNPIDVRRYKEYLQFMAGDDAPLGAIDQMFTGPLVGTFPVRNQVLADLLGVRYLLQPADLALEATVQTGRASQDWQKVVEDAAPTTFNFVGVRPGGADCGVQRLPAYAVYENRRAMPRAFVVPEASPMPPRDRALGALLATDLRRQVLLEGWDGGPTADTAGRATAATIREYRPNRVTIDLAPGAAGFLVLADVWFPGWTCRVDGVARPVYRADFLFRAVELPAGARRAEFRFVPLSYALGKWVSGATALVVLVVVVIGLVPWPSFGLAGARHEVLEHAAVG